MATLTVLNSISNTGHVARIQWTETSRLGVYSDDVSFKISDDVNVYDPDSMFVVSLRTRVLTVRIQSQRTHWPWSGTVEIMVSVNSAQHAAAFRGEVDCQLLISIHPDTVGETTLDAEAKTGVLSLKLQVSRPPPREKRILWDVFHSLAYPSAFVPNDNPKDSRCVHHVHVCNEPVIVASCL
jgi:hypothetical protein